MKIDVVDNSSPLDQLITAILENRVSFTVTPSMGSTTVRIKVQDVPHSRSDTRR